MRDSSCSKSEQKENASPVGDPPFGGSSISAENREGARCFECARGKGNDLQSNKVNVEVYEQNQQVRAKPESLCPVEDCARSPLPDGRVDLSALLSGYINSGFAVAFASRKSQVGELATAPAVTWRSASSGSGWQGWWG